jgi:hypothetical protein
MSVSTTRVCVLFYILLDKCNTEFMFERYSINILLNILFSELQKSKYQEINTILNSKMRNCLKIYGKNPKTLYEENTKNIRDIISDIEKICDKNDDLKNELYRIINDFSFDNC